jgi:hypothetical protein
MELKSYAKIEFLTSSSKEWGNMDIVLDYICHSQITISKACCAKELDGCICNKYLLKWIVFKKQVFYSLLQNFRT